jgi:hypothetical protein
MATFYVLPPRALLVEHLLSGLGIAHTQTSNCFDMAEALARSVETAGAYAVYRDDLPPHTGIAQSLADGFGAEPDDEIIEASLEGAPRISKIPLSPLAA